jgi:hypothetical protein
MKCQYFLLPAKKSLVEKALADNKILAISYNGCDFVFTLPLLLNSGGLWRKVL